MTERLSRIVISLEFAVLVLPYVVAPIGVFGLSLTDRNFLFGLMLLGCLVPQFAGWRLALAFVVGGVRYLRSMAAPWWWLATLGGVVPLIGLVAKGMELVFGPIQLGPSDSRLNDMLGTAAPLMVGHFAFGLVAAPLLVPLIHLWLERERRMTGRGDR